MSAKELDYSTASHIAGTIIEIGGVHVQRCAWCGELLVCTTTDQIMMMTSRAIPDRHQYVRIKDGEMQLLHWATPTTQIPEDFCYNMVELYATLR